MTHTQLRLSGVDKYYGNKNTGVHAVKALSMEVGSGEIVALLGSSGCGKTSTLRMIAGFEEVSQGTIEISDRAIHQLPPVKRNVAMAFEGYSLYPPLTVHDNIAFALKSSRLGRAQIAMRVSEVAEMLEIEDILERYPVSISGGQQQRASLARALIRDADLHLLDEPMGQLEPQLRAVLRGRIKRFIKERGLTAILVTHDQTEANALADRIAVMESGELQQYDTASWIKERPANLFSGTFIGEPPMNVFEAEVDSSEDSIRFTVSASPMDTTTEQVVLAYAKSDFSSKVLPQFTAVNKVVLGIRPYAVKRTKSGAKATVIANQWLGDQTHISASFAGHRLVLVEHERTMLEKGDPLHVALQADDLHLFDADNSVAIAHGRELAL